mmetsp:Transcript_211/g.427  ORF Transcript_211/g.427 Transcript_211/m.427 type:complete len:396 (-) Transcript_211:1120-2307(-)
MTTAEHVVENGNGTVDPPNKKITIFGVGRLGLVVALCLDQVGYDVLGIDVFPAYVDAINKKTLKSSEPRVEEMLKSSRKFRATMSVDEGLEHSDILFVFVATPNSGGEKFYDHSTVNRILSDINKRKVDGKHVIIGCTVLPGYCNEIGSFLLRDCTNTSLSYNPEFIAQGDIVNGMLKPDMVLIGEGSKAIGEILEGIYVRMCENKPKISRMSPASAEICKLGLNCFVTMKISYSNMIGDIADKTEGADKFAILEAIGADSRVGSKCIKPGYGFGGPCFPRDNRALGLYAESIGVKPLLPIATDEYNKFHANVMVESLLQLKQDVYVFEDVAYKEKCPVAIIEESQKLVLAKALVKHGKRVLIRDTADKIAAVQEDFGKLFEYEVIPKPIKKVVA